MTNARDIIVLIVFALSILNLVVDYQWMKKLKQHSDTLNELADALLRKDRVLDRRAAELDGRAAELKRQAGQ